MSGAEGQENDDLPFRLAFRHAVPSQYNRVDQGWDIQDTPGALVFAVAAGTVGKGAPDPGNFGNDCPILALDAPPPGSPSNTVYYGHAHVDPGVLGQAKDPRQTPEVRSRRGDAIAARKARQAAWEAAGGVALVDPEWYATDVLPALADVKLAAIVAATGWSKSYASVVRRGRYIPHVSTWPALAVAAGVTVPGPE